MYDRPPLIFDEQSIYGKETPLGSPARCVPKPNMQERPFWLILNPWITFFRRQTWHTWNQKLFVIRILSKKVDFSQWWRRWSWDIKSKLVFFYFWLCLPGFEKNWIEFVEPFCGWMLFNWWMTLERQTSVITDTSELKWRN